jgi:hypothetical protein
VSRTTWGRLRSSERASNERRARIGLAALAFVPTYD